MMTVVLNVLSNGSATAESFADLENDMIINTFGLKHFTVENKTTLSVSVS